MPSTGPMPKCSFVGVYRNTRVEGAVRSAERCDVVKFSKKVMSASKDDAAVEDGNVVSEFWFCVGDVIQ